MKTPTTTTEALTVKKQPVTTWALLGIIAVAFVIIGCLYNSQQKTTDPEPVKKSPPVKERKCTKIPVTVTTYQATEGQCDVNPYETASGSIIVEDSIIVCRWCGVSRDLLFWTTLHFGDTVHLLRQGDYIIKDVGSARLTKTVDILIPSNGRGFKTQDTLLIYE